MASYDGEREPFPDRILENLGFFFAVGAVGGSGYHFIKGMYSSPRGQRFAGGSQAVRMNAARVGGRFALWGGLFTALDYSMVHMRQKDDPWDSIIAGAATGGLFQMRRGLRASARSALFGGVGLALIEGVTIMGTKYLNNIAPQGGQTNFVKILPPQEAATAAASSSSSSQEEKKSGV